MSLKVNIMGVDLDEVFADDQQKEEDAEMAQNLQILENQQEELNEEMEFSSEQPSLGSDSERSAAHSSSGSDSERSVARSSSHDSIEESKHPIKWQDQRRMQRDQNNIMFNNGENTPRNQEVVPSDYNGYNLSLGHHQSAEKRPNLGQ